MSMIHFEWKKLFRGKTFYFFIGLTVLLIIGLFIRNYAYQDIIASERIEHFKHHTSEITSQLATDRKDLEDVGEQDGSILVKSIETGMSLHEKLYDLITALEDDEQLEALKIENRVYELALHYQSLGKYYPMSATDMEYEMMLNEDLLSKNLPKENLTSSIQIAVFMKQVSQYAFSTFVFLILLIIIGTPILKEFDDHTIKLTYVLPVSPNHMILSKWISSCLAGIGWLIVTFVTSFSVANIFGFAEEGSFDYPFFTKDMTLISASDYLQQAVMMSIFYLSMIIGLFMFLSFAIKNSYIVYIVLSILFIGNYIVLQSDLSYVWLPWNYQEMDLLILQTESFPWIALLGMVIVTTMLLIVSMVVSKRREY